MTRLETPGNIAASGSARSRSLAIDSNKNPSGIGDSLPLVTVIMPVRNEARYIARSLNAVLAQDYPKDRMEVLVADGMSTDDTPNIVQSIGSEHTHVRLIQNHGKGVPTGINAAMIEARGDIIVRVDGHCVIAPDYIRRCVVHLQNGNIDGVGGPIETIGETAVARTIALAMSSTFGVGGSAFRTRSGETVLVDTVAFPAYTRAAVKRAGPYDERLVRNEDDEYNYRLRKMGGNILLAADVHSRYYSRGSLRSLWKQYFQYGMWKVRVFQKHPRQMQPRHFVPAAFVAALVASLILALLFDVGVWIAIVLAVSYVTATLLASLSTASRDNWRALGLLPLVYSTLHLSYGFGFLVGLLRFYNGWRIPSSPLVST